MNGNRAPEFVPYLVHEGILVRLERTIKRLWILCIIIFLAFVGSNAAWLYYESQWEVVETVTTTTTQEVEQDSEDGGSNNNYFYGGDYNGEAKIKDDENND